MVSFHRLTEKAFHNAHAKIVNQVMMAKYLMFVQSLQDGSNVSGYEEKYQVFLENPDLFYERHMTAIDHGRPPLFPQEPFEVQRHRLLSLNNQGFPIVGDIAMEWSQDVGEKYYSAIARGGLGYLMRGILRGARRLRNVGWFGFAPVYEFAGNEWINWDNNHPLADMTFIVELPIPFQGCVYGRESHANDPNAQFYHVSMNGSPLFRVRQKDIFSRMYPGGFMEESQRAFLGRAFVEFVKWLGLKNPTVKMNELQLIWTVMAMLNDIDYRKQNHVEDQYGLSGSPFEGSKTWATLHTPLPFAFPVHTDVSGLEYWVGKDLCRDEMFTRENGSVRIDASKAGARVIDIANAVSTDGSEVIKILHPEWEGKIVGITNGNDEWSWRSPELNGLVMGLGSPREITAQQIMIIRSLRKHCLDQYLRQRNIFFDDPKKPRMIIVRRGIAYKLIGRTLLPIVHVLIAERNTNVFFNEREFRGCGYILMVSTNVIDDVGRNDADSFYRLMETYPGKVVFMEENNLDLMKLAVSAADVLTKSGHFFYPQHFVDKRGNFYYNRDNRDRVWRTSIINASSQMRVMG